MITFMTDKNLYEGTSYTDKYHRLRYRDGSDQAASLHALSQIFGNMMCD